MGYALLKILHLLSMVIWLGGMFFALFCLRPGAMSLPPPMRVPLMAAVLHRFFGIVAAVAAVIVASGVWMMVRVAEATRETGASLNMPLEWMLMAAFGVMMVLIFLHIRLALFTRLQRAVAAQDWPGGGAALGRIRLWVGVNLGLGVLIVVLTMMGQAS